LPPPSFHYPIFRTDQHIDLVARLAVNATMTPDNATVLRKSIKPYPLLRSFCTTLPSLTVIDELDANRSASEPLQPAATPKTMPLQG
jgi:hypothetical protein